MELDRVRRRALLALAAGIGLPAALRLALAQSSAKQGLRTVQGDMRINGKPAEAGTLVRPGDTIVLGNGALATFVVGESYSTRHHESPRYIYGDGRKRTIVPTSVANHTDSELILLESLVGRSPPQSFMESPVRY